MACGCFWDENTDNFAQEVYSNVSKAWDNRAGRGIFQSQNLLAEAIFLRAACLRFLILWQESIFCIAAAYGVYLY